PSAQIDRGDESVCQASDLDCRDQCGDRVGPGIRLHFDVDTAVGDDLGLVLRDGCENQQTAALRGAVDALCEKLTERLAVYASPHALLGYDAKAYHRHG